MEGLSACSDDQQRFVKHQSFKNIICKNFKSIQKFYFCHGFAFR
nr:MAG TPA: hypothetical protein [Caudoviricetes sp.]